MVSSNISNMVIIFLHKDCISFFAFFTLNDTDWREVWIKYTFSQKSKKEKYCVKEKVIFLCENFVSYQFVLWKFILRYKANKKNVSEKAIAGQNQFMEELRS